MTEIEKFFGVDGVLAKRFLGYRPRQGQIQMAEAVGKAIRERRHLTVQAPTGVGKSLAYLVPAVMSGERCIVVTENIALQEQLARKELPMLKEIFPSLTFAVLKGISNYVCHKKVAESEFFDVPAEFTKWMHETKTGDLSEFDDDLPAGIKHKVSVSSDECDGKECRHYPPLAATHRMSDPNCRSCFVYLARAQAEKAQIIVTNYAYYLIMLKIGQLLPPQVVIFDEGHRTANEARDKLGFEMARKRFKILCNRIEKEEVSDRCVEARKAIDREAEEFYKTLETIAREKHYREPFRLMQGVDASALLRPLRVCLDIFPLPEPEPGQPFDEVKAKIHYMLESTIRQLEIVSSYDPHDNPYVLMLEPSDKYGQPPKIVVKMKYPAEALRNSVFAERTVIVCSATLDIPHEKEQLGIDKSSELEVESPFDWPKQLRLYVDHEAIDPRDRERKPERLKKLADRIIELANMAGGNLLGLFTNFDSLQTVAQDITPRVPYPVLVHSKGANRRKLVEEFKKGGRILLGTKSFWTGIDVPGKALSVLVIEALPFVPPTDPMMQAFQEDLGRQTFGKMQLPATIIAFRQGLGRLIRTETDKGVVVVMDPRLAGVNCGYADRFVEAIAPIDGDLWINQRVAEFLNG